MNITPFYVGQKIICIVDTSHEYMWVYENGSPAPGPQKDEPVTCDGYDSNQRVLLREYKIGEGYNPSAFVPAQQLKFPLMKYTKVIEKELVSEN